MAFKPKSTFTDKDTGYTTLMTTFKTVKGRAVFVGFTRSSGEYKPKEAGKSQEAITVAAVAAINEFGTKDGKIPARPFMAPAVDDNKNKINRTIDTLLKKIGDGKFNEVGALRILGAMVQGLMREKILTGNFKPNRPSTIARKGEGKRPLIDTSQMIGAIDFEVVDLKGKSGGTT